MPFHARWLSPPPRTHHKPSCCSTPCIKSCFCSTIDCFPPGLLREDDKMTRGIPSLISSSCPLVILSCFSYPLDNEDFAYHSSMNCQIFTNLPAKVLTRPDQAQHKPFHP